jgi:hypothetical protein
MMTSEMGIAITRRSRNFKKGNILPRPVFLFYFKMGQSNGRRAGSLWNIAHHLDDFSVFQYGSVMLYF